MHVLLVYRIGKEPLEFISRNANASLTDANFREPSLGDQFAKLGTTNAEHLGGFLNVVSQSSEFTIHGAIKLP